MAGVGRAASRSPINTFNTAANHPISALSVFNGKTEIFDKQSFQPTLPLVTASLYLPQL